MKEKIKNLQELAIEELSKVESLKDLNEVRIKYLGKQGELTAILRGMKDVSPEERPILGQLVNEVRNLIEQSINTLNEKFEEEELNKKLSR